MSSGPSSNSAPRANYSKEELSDIYALAKMWLETGQIKRAEVAVKGLTTVAPEFMPGWLARCVVESSLGNVESALQAARRALKLQPESATAMMLIVTASLTIGDISTAGTYLGEVGELVEQGKIAEPNLIRLFKMQMARYTQGR